MVIWKPYQIALAFYLVVFVNQSIELSAYIVISIRYDQEHNNIGLPMGMNYGKQPKTST
jgi:hypothetical protein